MEHSIFQEGSYVRHKTNLNKFKTIEITSNIFNNNGMRLENQLQEETWKIHKYVARRHATEQPIGQRGNQKINWKIDKGKWKYIKTYQMQQKLL